MRKLAIAVALASTALATPAVARDHSTYVGLEGGGMIVEDPAFRIFDANDHRTLLNVDHSRYGLDIDAVGGYDWGPVRTELELGYKHAGVDQLRTESARFPAGGHSTVLSAMANALVDFGNEDA